MKLGWYDTPTLLASLGFVCGVFQYRKLQLWERLIVLILLLNVITDFISAQLIAHNRQTVLCYNLFVPCEIIIMLVVYYLYVTTFKIKKVLVYTIPLLSIFFIINSLFFQNIKNEFVSFSFCVGGIFVALFSYLIWKHVIQEEKLESKNLILWFSAANFLYYIITIPVLSANNWLVIHNSELALPVQIINLVMYCLFSVIISFGFIWRLKEAG